MRRPGTPWLPSAILAAPEGSLPGDTLSGPEGNLRTPAHAQARLSDAAAGDHSSLRGAGQVPESVMILELAEAFGLSEDALVSVAASTARVHKTTISSVIMFAWLDYCAPYPDALPDF